MHEPAHRRRQIAVDLQSTPSAQSAGGDSYYQRKGALWPCRLSRAAFSSELGLPVPERQEMPAPTTLPPQ
ncbi:MAG: hypothetical protein CM15mP21_1330 [Hyphomicrobiales bacterium]|nr:MAG: hypothetical protein CM15mP21_1330 [Hyphomicrobiales bacterium]